MEACSDLKSYLLITCNLFKFSEALLGTAVIKAYFPSTEAAYPKS